MEWLKAIRNSMDSRKDDDKSINNLIKFDLRKSKERNRDTLENAAGVRLFGYVDSSKEMKELTKELSRSDFKQQTDYKASFDFKPLDKLTTASKSEFKFENELTNDLKETDFNTNQIDFNDQFNIESLIDEFPIGEWIKIDCEICFQECWLHRRVCCNYAVCSNCLGQYFKERICLGSFSIECINNHCHSPVNRNEISISLEPKFKEIYHNLLRANNDLGKLIRTCPNCNYLHKLKDNSELKKMRKTRKKDPTVSRYVLNLIFFVALKRLFFVV